MSKTTVQVVLRDDVESLGRSGELVRVKPGYARNFLLPRGLAALATRGNVARIAHERKLAVARTAKLRSEAALRAEQLSAVSVDVAAQAGANGRLFGSVGSKDIAAALEAKGFQVDRRKIELEDAIKELGEYEVPIKVGYDHKATVKVRVQSAE